jgi:acid stress-induced BolA-like protein IbaG/YrbA
MMIQPDQVIELIKLGLPDADVQAQTQDGEHYDVTVISEQFVGKPLVKQHQLVYQTLQGVMGTNVLHAVALKTAPPQPQTAISS